MSSFTTSKYSLTITNAASLSDAAKIEDAAVVAIVADITATLSFQGSYDGSTFYDIVADDGTEYTVTYTSGKMAILDLNNFLAARYIKVRSGTSSSPSTVSGNKSITLFTKEV